MSKKKTIKRGGKHMPNQRDYAQEYQKFMNEVAKFSSPSAAFSTSTQSTSQTVTASKPDYVIKLSDRSMPFGQRR